MPAKPLPDPVVTDTPPELDLELASQMLQRLLERHNELRALHGAPPLRYSDACAALAQDHLRAGRYTKDCPGFNVFECDRPVTAVGATDAWYRQGQAFDWQTLEGAPAFRRVLWRSSTELGAARSEDGNVMVVCYGPEGTTGAVKDNLRQLLTRMENITPKECKVVSMVQLCWGCLVDRVRFSRISSEELSLDRRQARKQLSSIRESEPSKWRTAAQHMSEAPGDVLKSAQRRCAHAALRAAQTQRCADVAIRQAHSTQMPRWCSFALVLSLDFQAALLKPGNRERLKFDQGIQRELLAADIHGLETLDQVCVCSVNPLDAQHTVVQVQVQQPPNAGTDDIAWLVPAVHKAVRRGAVLSSLLPRVLWRSCGPCCWRAQQEAPLEEVSEHAPKGWKLVQELPAVPQRTVGGIQAELDQMIQQRRQERMAASAMAGKSSTIPAELDPLLTLRGSSGADKLHLWSDDSMLFGSDSAWEHHLGSGSMGMEQFVKEMTARCAQLRGEHTGKESTMPNQDSDQVIAAQLMGMHHTSEILGGWLCGGHSTVARTPVASPSALPPRSPDLDTQGRPLPESALSFKLRKCEQSRPERLFGPVEPETQPGRVDQTFINTWLADSDAAAVKLLMQKPEYAQEENEQAFTRTVHHAAAAEEELRVLEGLQRQGDDELATREEYAKAQLEGCWGELCVRCIRQMDAAEWRPPLIRVCCHGGFAAVQEDATAEQLESSVQQLEEATKQQQQQAALSAEEVKRLQQSNETLKKEVQRLSTIKEREAAQVRGIQQQLAQAQLSLSDQELQFQQSIEEHSATRWKLHRDQINATRLRSALADKAVAAGHATRKPAAVAPEAIPTWAMMAANDFGQTGDSRVLRDTDKRVDLKTMLAETLADSPETERPVAQALLEVFQGSSN
eukprot:TRINITY_DN10458_c0_g1_i1.p1 TRINITY_DN10458_c0_g1~~TRINITY_DN10458_c0_g1_i1.p1  ORF type:complete len:905 (-),score=243.49 TRINITY_DN10458_c0_g1_i1:86-2800(-)